MLMKEFSLKRQFQVLGAIQAKIAEMATNAYAGESATYRAAADMKTESTLE